MSSIKTWLAVDIGTTGTKAALLDQEGTTLRSTTRSYPTAHQAERISQQAADWWQAVVEAIRDLNATEAEAIALTGQMQDVILLAADGTPVCPVILYSDSRAHAEAEQLNADFGTERLRAITGNIQDAGSLLAKLRWLTVHEPETLASSRYLLFGAADYIGFRLTGVAATDSTTASTTGLLDLTGRRLLTTDDLQALDLGHIAPLLPSVHAGGTVIGHLSDDAARQLGLRAGIPIHHGPGDAGATTLGAGAGEAGRAYGYIGTSGWIAFSGSTRTAQADGVFTLAHPRADSFITIAPLLTAGGNLDWLVDLFGTGADQYGTLIDSALARPATPLLYLPYLNGERSPFRDPFARGAFIGLNASHQTTDLWRAVLEGVVFAYRHALETLLDDPLAALTLTGGGTRSRAWCQLFADVLGQAVTVTADAANVGGRGAVLAARVAAGELDGETPYVPDQGFPTAFTLTPQVSERERARYERHYHLFQASYLALKPIFADL